MYGNNPYIQNYNQQTLNDKIDSEIARLQQMKNHNTLQQPAINQTFQLAPQGNGIKFANTIEDVQRELAIVDTPFVNTDYSMLWIKNAKGEIRTFNIQEVKPKDEKDLIIEELKSQINRLEGRIRDEQQYDKTSDEYESKQFDESIKDEKPSNVSNVKPSKPKSR